MRVFTVLYGIGTINVKNAEDTIFGIFRHCSEKWSTPWVLDRDEHCVIT